MSNSPITCLNGVFLPTSEATVPVADRGFRFGDGVFETIRFEQGVPYQWELHLSRMNAGLAALRINPPVVDWVNTARSLMQKNSLTDGFLRIAISRGVGSRGYMPDENITPTWVMECLPPAPLQQNPVKLWLSTITRPLLSALPTNHKLAQGVGNTLALLEARDHGCDDALMLTYDGKLCETASANLFWIKDDKIFTPTLSTGCLAGSTRAALMRLSAVEEVVANTETLKQADAIFITNARLGAWLCECEALDLQANDHPMLIDLTTRLQAYRATYIEQNRTKWIIA